MDTLVGSALMLIVFLGIAGVFKLSIEVITNNRIRAGAIALANERMEYLRSLSYSQIGVIGGIPAGNVPQEETVDYNNVSYLRRTFVSYTDDPGDGLGAADSNSIIADFKTIRVEINWQSREGERGITLIGRVSPFGIETAVPGGTLTIIVRDESGAPVSNAQVDITNIDTTPDIDIRTYTNIDGEVTFIGAPAASNYQIAISKTGYSSAQTYGVSAGNPNPDPRHLTVAESQTTSQSFTIDLVSTKRVETYTAIQEGAWTETMADSSKIATSASTTVSGGTAHLTGTPGAYDAAGSMQSVSVTPALLYAWKTFAATTTIPAQTTLRFHFYDAGEALIPEAALPGNASGLSAPVDLSGVSTTTYPSLRVASMFSSSDPNETPSIDAYEFVYDYGPEPFPDLSFDMRGNKAIGNNPTVYKYDETHSSGASASITLSDMEADTYTLSLATSGYMLAESCEPQPEALLPASMQTTKLYVLPASAHSLLVDVRGSDNVLLAGASVQLTATGYDTTKLTSSCGQAFFGSLASGTYVASVTFGGYQLATSSVSVSGSSRASMVLIPQ